MGLERAERAVGAGSRGCFSHLLAIPSDDHLHPPLPAALPPLYSRPFSPGHTKTEGARGLIP